MPSKKTWFFNSPQLYRIAKAAVARIPAERQDHEGAQPDALVACVFAALALEGFVNEFGELVADEYYWDSRVSPNLSGLARAVAAVEAEHGSLELKLHVIRIALRGSAWSPGEAPFQDLLLLVRLRNALVHLKLDVRSGTTDSPKAGPPPSVITHLRAKNILAHDQDPKAATWTLAVSTRAAGKWACKVVTDMVQETIRLIPASDFRRDVDIYFGDRFTPDGDSRQDLFDAFQ